MPLDTKNKIGSRSFHRLHNPVFGTSRDRQFRCGVFDSLMVMAVDHHHFETADGFRQQAVLNDSKTMARLERERLLSMWTLFLGCLRQILDQRAAEGDIQDLQAAADRQDRQITFDRRMDQRNLVPVTPLVGRFRRRVNGIGLPIKTRMDVITSAQQQSVYQT